MICRIVFSADFEVAGSLYEAGRPSALPVRRRAVGASAAETGLSSLGFRNRAVGSKTRKRRAFCKKPFLQKACAWLANALIRPPAMLSTAVNPTDGLRFDGDAGSIAEGGVHPT
jgi:hypothetical protein